MSIEALRSRKKDPFWSSIFDRYVTRSSTIWSSGYAQAGSHHDRPNGSAMGIVRCNIGYHDGWPLQRFFCY